MDVIDRINERLAVLGKSGAEMSRDLGLSNSIYSQWNTRKTKPSKKTIKLLAPYLETSVEYLLTGKDKSPSTLAGAAAAAAAGVVGATLLPGAAAIAAIDTAGLSVLKGKKKQPASQNGDGLSSRDLRLIEWFRSLPPEKQKAILSLGDGPEDLSD